VLHGAVPKFESVPRANIDGDGDGDGDRDGDGDGDGDNYGDYSPTRSFDVAELRKHHSIQGPPQGLLGGDGDGDGRNDGHDKGLLRGLPSLAADMLGGEVPSLQKYCNTSVTLL
jgi:hypothetical protein